MQMMCQRHQASHRDPCPLRAAPGGRGNLKQHRLLRRQLLWRLRSTWPSGRKRLVIDPQFMFELIQRQQRERLQHSEANPTTSTGEEQGRRDEMRRPCSSLSAMPLFV